VGTRRLLAEGRLLENLRTVQARNDIEAARPDAAPDGWTLFDGPQVTCDAVHSGAMPIVLRSGPYRFFFYSSDRKEPPHVHIERGQYGATFWLGIP
jgi:hypothetical protein